MEIVHPSDTTEHKWLEWLGLEEPPPEADSWVPIVRGLDVDDFKTDSSSLAARLVDVLASSGIAANPRSYHIVDAPTSGVVGISVGGAAVERVAVLVHNRDRERATEIAADLNQTLDSELRVNDAELTREALEAAPPPQD